MVAVRCTKTRRTRVQLGLTTMVFAMMACSEAPSEPEIPFQGTANMHDFMVWAMEPAADVIWDSAGYIITAEGEVDLQPTTQEGWDHVRNSATTVAELGNVLMIPGYRADTEDWVAYSAGLVRAGMKARAAAEAQDADALFQAGGELYNVCRACHNRYMAEPGN